MSIKFLSDQSEVAQTTRRISTFDATSWPIDEQFRETRSQLLNGRYSTPEPVPETDSHVLDWDQLREDPNSLFGIDRGEEVRFTITPDGDLSQHLDVDGLFVKRRSSKLLIVFHGALNRDKYTLPRFEYKSSLKDFDGSILFLQDPTLYLHKRLGLGWYIGTDSDDGHSIISYLVSEASRVLGPKQLVLAGSSGGGFAALAISARIPGSAALVFSPQTSVEKYNLNHRRRLMSAAFPTLTPTIETLTPLEDRLDMGALYSKGTENKIFYLQNTGDPFHMKNHCLPFLPHVGLNLSEGEMRNKRIKLECRFLSEGHNAPRPQQMRLYVNRVFEGGF